MKQIGQLSGILFVFCLMACSQNGSSSAQSPRTADEDEAGAHNVQDREGSHDAAPTADAAQRSSNKGIFGTVKVLQGTPKGSVLVALPGNTEIVKTATVQSDGSFHVPDLAPETYRLILPADGIHSTADTYVTIDAESGRADVTVACSKGCPVTITVRDHRNDLIPGAELQLTLTDLPHVTSPNVHSSTTDTQGKTIVMGSCVRGYYKGTLSVKGRGSYAIDHGYVGTGRDTFDIVLPEQPDAGVTYANDD